MERTIYYKDHKESFDDLADLLLDYLGKCSPVTYWSDDNELQCDANKNRSLDDLLLLANHYFPGSHLKDLLKAVVEGNKKLEDDNKCILVYTCGTINKPILHRELYIGRNWINGVASSHSNCCETDSVTKNSQFNIPQINKIFEEIL